MDNKSIGFVVELSGDAQIRSDDGVIRVLNIGDAVYEGEILTTGVSTNIILEFFDGARLQLGDYSEILLDETVFSALDYIVDRQVDQVDALEALDVDLLDPSNFNLTSSAAAASDTNALRQQSIYARVGDQGIVETRDTPFEIIDSELTDRRLLTDEEDPSPTAVMPDGLTTDSTPSLSSSTLAPSAINDASHIVSEDSLLTNIDVMGNDTDPDGDPLTVISASALNGTVTINPDGSLNYQPDPEYSGPDTITYMISDGRGGSDTATVSITRSKACSTRRRGALESRLRPSRTSARCVVVRAR